jgi:excisionase family DNA binding protein
LIEQYEHYLTLTGEPTAAAILAVGALLTDKPSDALLTLSEAAEILGYKPSGLRKLVKRGSIRHIQVGRGPIKFRREWLEEFHGDQQPTLRPAPKKTSRHTPPNFTPTHLKRPAA